jgi:hypothetical protein
MNKNRNEILAELHYVAQFHLCKATTAFMRDDFVKLEPSIQVHLLEAVMDTAGTLGHYVRALHDVHGYHMETYLPELLIELDNLDAACRAAGAASNNYDDFRKALLG